jgi:DNA-binding GntR family transcriptional regulator
VIVHDSFDRRKQYRDLARERRRLESAVRERSPLRLHAQLRSGLKDGTFVENDRLNEDALIREYSTSRNSVRAALTLLAAEGIVTRSPRSGTVVIERIDDIRIDSGGNWAPDDLSHHVVHEIGSSVIPTPAVIAKALRTDAATVRVEQWIDYDDSVPACIYIKYSLADAPTRRISLDSADDFDSLFEQTYGVPIDRIDCNIQAVSCDERTARLLEVEPGTAMLLKERLLWDADGSPRELSHTYYIASKASLSTTSYATSRAVTRTEDARATSTDVATVAFGGEGLAAAV